MPALKRPVVDEHGFYVGALVEHDEYGLGKIKELNGLGANRMVRILFRNGLKAFNINHVKLTVVTDD
jgi:hypothetical protein